MSSSDWASTLWREVRVPLLWSAVVNAVVFACLMIWTDTDWPILAWAGVFMLCVLYGVLRFWVSQRGLISSASGSRARRASRRAN